VNSENLRDALFSTVGVLSESFKRKTTWGFTLNPVLKYGTIGWTILISNVNCSRQPYRAWSSKKPLGFLAKGAHVVKNHLGYKISSISCIWRLYSSGLRKRSRHMACRRSATFHGTLILIQWTKRFLIPVGRNFDSTDICFNMHCY
jgi:hypothetical protein